MLISVLTTLLFISCSSSPSDTKQLDLFCNQDENANKVEDDADCDGVLTDEDCDDNNAMLLHIENDADCDGIVSAQDCDDNDTESTITANDSDCDGFTSIEDCNDDDAELQLLRLMRIVMGSLLMRIVMIMMKILLQ